jgi:hypothetical protein
MLKNDSLQYLLDLRKENFVYHFEQGCLTPPDWETSSEHLVTRKWFPKLEVIEEEEEEEGAEEKHHMISSSQRENIIRKPETCLGNDKYDKVKNGT